MTMSDGDLFMRHWVDIDPERMERYETMFQWSEAAEAFYAPARIGEGQVMADFGCGPGHGAIEFARRVGPQGHVHAFDINAEFIESTRQKAAAAGFSERITAHLIEDAGLPLADAALDRIVTRNTLVYVQDPVETLGEFRRVLKPGGIAHAIESDWSLTVVEPLASAEWAAVIRAASWAWRTPEVGRKLYGAARRAGFAEVEIRVLTKPDSDGRLLGMIKTVIGYARQGGSLDPARIDRVMQTVERGLADGTYLAVAPQFLVTAIA
jgi:ubiquinone/menaquinone biosynthesis C-methylase UbiE